jgi:uncharacterized protein (TIGR03118 family)
MASRPAVSRGHHPGLVPERPGDPGRSRESVLLSGVPSRPQAALPLHQPLAACQSQGIQSIPATNFRFGTIEAFDGSFNLVKTFTDPAVPTGFAPFGIHGIGGKLFVTFAKQKPDKHDHLAGPGNGFVDVFSPNGDLLQRLVSEGR